MKNTRSGENTVIEIVEWIEGNVRHVHILALDQATRARLADSSQPLGKGMNRLNALRELGARRVNGWHKNGHLLPAVRAINMTTGFEFKTACYDPNWEGECDRLQNPRPDTNAIAEYHPDKKHLVYTAGHDEGKHHGPERLYDYETGTELQLERNWVRGRKSSLDEKETIAYAINGERKSVFLGERRIINKPATAANPQGEKLLYKEFVAAVSEDYPVSLPHGGIMNLPAKQKWDIRTGECKEAIWCDLGHHYYEASTADLREINASGKFPAKDPRPAWG